MILLQVNWRTKIIVLDDASTRPVKLARALSDIGFKAYVLKVCPFPRKTSSSISQSLSYQDTVAK